MESLVIFQSGSGKLLFEVTGAKIAVKGRTVLLKHEMR